MDSVLLDIRYGVRQLFKQRASSITAIVTLALGMGASTAIFSVVDATMLRPLPYANPEQLVTVYVEVLDRDEWSSPSPSMADMRDWQAADDVFSVVAGSGSAFRGRITDGATPERIQVRHFTEDYLSMHGVEPLIGRGFTRDDTHSGSTLVALLGYGYWQSHYGGRTDVLGQVIRLDDDSATIVGVLPAWFHATTPLATPLRVTENMFGRRGTGAVHVEARLRPDVTIEQARQRLAVRMAGSTAGRADTQGRPDSRPARPVIASRLESATALYGTTVAIFAGAVGLILLIAAVNVAGLLLARGSARYSEFAVRASLGAGRMRLIRQLLTESLALAVPATALGVLIAWLSLDVILANLPFPVPVNSPIVINRRVLLMTMALLVPTTLFFSLVPALRLSQVRIGLVLARGGRQVGSSFSRRGGQCLIAAEIAIAVILVTGAGLMIRSFVRLSSVDLGFNPNGLLTMEVLPLERTPAAHQAYYAALLTRLRTLPSIASVGLVDNFVLAGSTSYSGVMIDGRRITTMMFEVTPGYFETIGAVLREGTLPAAGDAQSRGVVINRSAAKAYFPSGPVVGREFVRAGQPDRPWVVRGVIDDLRHGGPLNARSLGHPQAFFPLESSEFDLNAPMMVVVRPSGRSAGLGEQLRDVATSVGPRVLVERIRDANEYFSDRVVTPRRRTVLLGLLGGLGLILALVGVFGMTAYAVTRRTAEIGVRMAFGARPGQVVQTMLRDSAVPIVIGTVLGLAGAVASTRVIQSFLYETAPTDRTTLAMVAVMLVASGCIAALVPAMRAARVDPASTLRTD
jgi:putative ABC transport system permease protein